jgi:RNA polymerase sigma-70 factor (ECF subfamily)
VARREEAEDITMAVFAAAFADLPRFRGQCPPLLWLLGIARRKIVDSLRRRATTSETLAADLPPGVEESLIATTPEPSAALERAERQRTIRVLVSRLQPDQREALLQHLEELSIAEIAVVMGRSPAAVNSLLQRARANLYRMGHAYFVDEEEQL